MPSEDGGNGSEVWTNLLLDIHATAKESKRRQLHGAQLVQSHRVLGSKGGNTRPQPQPHRPHHGGGGKHDNGPNGQHLRYNDKNGAKSAKGSRPAASATALAGELTATAASTKSAKGAAHAAAPAGADDAHAADDAPLTRCHIAEGSNGASIPLVDLDPGAASKSYACIAMCYVCAASHMSSVDFCTNDQRDAGVQLSVHLAVLMDQVEQTREMYAGASTGFMHCTMDDCNMADVCEGGEGGESGGSSGAESKSAKAGGSGGKAGKAVLSLGDDGWGSADEVHTTTATSATPAVDAGYWWSGGSGKAGKDAKSGKSDDDDYYDMSYSHDDWWSGTHSATAPPLYHHKAGKDAKYAKHGKAGKVDLSYSNGDGMSMHPDSIHPKSGKATGWWGSGADLKGKAKSAKSLTHFFIKESAYEQQHHQDIKGGKEHDDSWWGGQWGHGKAGKASDDMSMGPGHGSKAAKSAYLDLPDNVGMESATMPETPGELVAAPADDEEEEEKDEAPPSDEAALPPTTELLTLSPTPAEPESAAPEPTAPEPAAPEPADPPVDPPIDPPADPPADIGIPSFIPEPPEDDPLAKWWHSEGEDGKIGCEYSSGYPEGEENLFETKEKCCDFFPQGCPDSGDNDAVLQAPPAPEESEDERPPRFDWFGPPAKDEDDAPTAYPTWYPTADPDVGLREPMLGEGPGLDQGLGQEEGSQEGSQEQVPPQEVLLEPFGLKLFASVAEPHYNEEVVRHVTMEHLIHSFRSRDWRVDELHLIVLERERQLMKARGDAASATTAVTLRWLAQHPVYEIIFGGVLYFPEGVATPNVRDMDLVVKDSFKDERGDYYVGLLQEAAMEIERAKLDHKLEAPIHPNKDESHSGGFSFAGLMIGLSSAIGGVSLLAVGRKQYQKHKDRQLLVDDLAKDLENGDYKDYAIRLQYTNDEIEAFPGSTVAMTSASAGSQDHLSVPSLVRGGEQDDEIVFGDTATPGGKNTGSSVADGCATVSPLESPQDVMTPAGDALPTVQTPPAQQSTPACSASSTPTRYVSVFTVKKDCGGRALHEVDLRALAIAYLSRMLKRFPNTHLLPYDKHSPLPAITNIRNIPDDMEELQQYVGNARLDDRTGKVLFNLRVESDEPVSRMKTSSGGSSRGSGKFKSSSSYSSGKGGRSDGPPAIIGNTTVKSMDEMDKEEMPRSPGEFSDVKL